ncbi:MAG: hypothetical protein ACO1SV_06320 [Fimbriimonas sp.]
MSETVRASIAMLHGAGALILLVGLLQAVRLGIVDGTSAAQTVAARTSMGALTVLAIATFIQATAEPNPTGWMQFGTVLSARICGGRLFAGDRHRLE